MDFIQLYTDFLVKNSNIKRKLSIVCDGSNGSTGKILQVLLPKLGLSKYKLINEDPDPEFHAHGPNPLLPGVLDDLGKTVIDQKADFGIAFDADGDRAFFVDETGRTLPSFIIAALLFQNAKPPFVADELVFQALKAMKIFSDKDLQPSRVGVFFVKQKMREISATTGAEFSGHFYYKDFFGADSGLFTLVRVLSILSSLTSEKTGNNVTLSEFADSLPPHSVTNDDLKIEGKDVKAISEKVIEYYKAKGATIEDREGVTVCFSDKWLNVRASNTEPVLRFYAGGPTAEVAKALIEEAKELI